MAALVAQGPRERADEGLMHPFFQKALIKGDVQQLSSSATSLDINPLDAPVTDLTASENGDSPFEENAEEDRNQDQGIIESLVNGNIMTMEPKADMSKSNDGFQSDLNSARRKRRKLTPQRPSDTEVSDDGIDRKNQLQLAADSHTEIMQEEDSVSANNTGQTPERKKASLNPSPSPRRTPRKARTKLTSSPEVMNSVAAPSSDDKSTGQTVSRQRTPRKKVIRLNANGKLLSSPARISPFSKGNAKRSSYGKDIGNNELKVTLRYGNDSDGRARVGQKIDDLLAEPVTSKSSNVPMVNDTSRTTHPFFLGKLAPRLVTKTNISRSEGSSKSQESEQETSPRTHKPVAWKDIVFTSNKPNQPNFVKDSDDFSAPWPPSMLHHLGNDPRTSTGFDRTLRIYANVSSKSKEQRIQISASEDILRSFSKTLLSSDTKLNGNIRLPKRILADGRRLLEILNDELPSSRDESSISAAMHPATLRLRSLIPESSTTFDRGEMDDGTCWTSRYAPQRAEEVLQPEAVHLRSWLKSLATSAVQKTNSPPTGKSRSSSGKMIRKKKRRKVSAELNGFIASSDDEAEGLHGNLVKNAVLISGPSGCGKTASVFAVAKELDFEVFEVHPGMRRSGKDIFDKVGDMTQNHLVQGVDSMQAADFTSIAVDGVPVQDEVASGKQSTMNSFLSSKTKIPKKQNSASKAQGSNTVEMAKQPKGQKQSLILLEEVDVLFEEDRGFWSGVFSLINQSKRPVVFTCNDETAIPFGDLPLHAIFRYQAPASSLTSDYLVALAANEGHITDVNTVDCLYRSKNQDLRATITELDFWCQMGVGSRKAGLDWMLDRNSPSSNITAIGGPLRVLSKDTYSPCLTLGSISRATTDEQQEMILDYAQEVLGLSVKDWHESEGLQLKTSAPSNDAETADSARRLQQITNLFDSRSVLDLLDDSLTAAFSVRIATALTPENPPVREDDLVRAYFAKSVPFDLTRENLVDAFEAFTVEKAIFPPAQGRLAPSLDSANIAIATDIAPYIRSIVAFDQRLEEQRGILAGGLQGKKARTTRAARAALEGGNKKNTRREKWFSERVDYGKVMSTGGKGWPLAYQCEEPIAGQESARLPFAEEMMSSQTTTMSAQSGQETSAGGVEG